MKIKYILLLCILNAGFIIPALDILLPKIMENAEAIFGEK